MAHLLGNTERRSVPFEEIDDPHLSVSCVHWRAGAGLLLGRHGTDTAGWRADQFRKAGVARTFQAGRLFKDLTVLENTEVTAVGLGMHRRAATSRALELLDWIRLADKAGGYAGALAYTDRRLGIARALVVPPAFALLDEPAAGMSDAECEELVALIASIPNRFARGVLLIEHHMRVVMGISHRIHVLDGGRTIAEGTLENVQRREGVLTAYLGMEAV